MYSLKHFLPTLETNLSTQIGDALSKINIISFDLPEYDNEILIAISVEIQDELELDIMGMSYLSLVLGTDGVESESQLILALYPRQSIEFEGFNLGIRFSTSLFKPVYKNKSGKFVVVPPTKGKSSQLQISIQDVYFSVDDNGDIEFNFMDEALSLSFNHPFMIGDSGIVIDADDIKLAFGKAGSNSGVGISKATIYLPGGLSNLVPGALTITNAFIGSGGFTGQTGISDLNPKYDTKKKKFTGKGSGTVFGYAFGLNKINIGFKQNALTACDIEGQIALPFFDQPLDVDLGFDLDGNISVAIAKQDGLLDFTYKTGNTKIFNVKIGSLGFKQKGNEYFVYLDGEIKPLIGGLDWPSFKVDELRIDSKGNVHLEGGWLNLREQYSLDFHGFQFEITKLGFGKEKDGGKWIGFSGSLKLVDGLPAGGSVEGLRITWYEDGRDPGVTFNGVGVEFEIPKTLRFKGAVAYREISKDIHRFDGAIKLEFTTLNLEIDGQLVVGKTKDFTFFAIFLDLELPAGIPLWSTGLGLYGMAGLFAYQMEPGKKKDERWYGIGKENSYYHRTPEGVVQLAKWIEKQDSLGLGAGVTIGTISDNGYVFSGKVILALVFPGPQIFIEGKANLLKERSKLDEEPTFRALAVLDNREGTFLIGVDAEYKYGSGGELIEIGGSAEAFFSLNDASAWHLYLGEKDPRDKRIQARIFKLFNTNSYFMLDANQLAFGSWVGFDKRWKFGPLRVTVEAWIENNVVVSWKPAHLYGDLWLHGKGELAIWWFGLGICVDAGIAADVFDPFHLLGKFSVSINLPWPLPNPSATIKLEWGPEPDAPPLPLPLKEVAIEHSKVTTTWALPRGSQPLLLPNYDVDKNGYYDVKEPAPLSKAFKPSSIPVIPLDCRPQITFTRPVHDDANVGSNPQPPSPACEQIGDPEQDEGPVKVCYRLKALSLDKWIGSEADKSATTNWIDTGKKFWKPVAWAPNAKINETQLYGAWAPIPAMPDKNGTVVAQTKLRLWSKTAFDYTSHGGSAYDEWFTDRFKDYPCLKTPPDKKICYDFENLNINNVLSPPWKHPSEQKLLFTWSGFGLTPRINKIPTTKSGKSYGLCFGQNGLVEVSMQLPQRAKKVSLIIADDEGIEVTGVDANGIPCTTSYAGVGVHTLDLSCSDITRVIVKGYLRTCIFDVCFTVGPSQAEIVRRQEMEKHLKDELVRWQHKGNILEPYTTYRLKINTILETKEFPYDSDFNTKRDLTEFVYFRTEGPPGLTRLFIPQGTSNEQQTALHESGGYVVVDNAGKERKVDSPDKMNKNERLVLKSKLNHLTPYVYQTLPATVPAKGKNPLLPRSVYRAYDIGVEFNENYVDLMYRIAGRDLGLYLYNNNNRPVRDAEGRLIVLSNRWSNADTIRLTRSDVRTITTYNSSSCKPEIKNLPRNKTLNSSEEHQVLDGDTVYEARLVPLLLHEEFADDLAGWESLDADSTIVMHNTPSAWKGHISLKGKKATANKKIITLDGDPDLSQLTAKLDIVIFDDDEVRVSGRYQIESIDKKLKTITVDGHPKLKNGSSKWVIPSAVVQTSDIFGGTFDPRDPVKPGTMLLRKNDTRLPNSHPDQPIRWTDYRLSVYLRTTDDDDAMGVVFRCPDSLKVYPKNYYLFTMDRWRRYRRLVRVIDGKYTILAEDDFIYQENRDYLVTIEAIGKSLGIYQNGKRIFSVLDSALDRGTIGFYTWGNKGARFSTPRVDDFRKVAPSVYRFRFATSQFANFFHQLHSYQDETWSQAVPVGASTKPILSKGISLNNKLLQKKPTEIEARNYNKLIAQIFTQSTRQKLQSVQVTKIKQNKDATDAVALLVESPEPIDWKRTQIAVLHSARAVPKPKVPVDVKLTEVSFGKIKPNEETVSLLLRDTADLTDYRIEYWKMPAAIKEYTGLTHFTDKFDTMTGGLLFLEAFGPNALDHYTIIDKGTEHGPANWLSERTSSGDYIKQTASVFGGSITGDVREQVGSIALTGSPDWANMRVHATLRSESSGAVGLVFRYFDINNWYRFSMDDNGRYLIRSVNGKTTVLWQDHVFCERSKSYAVVIEAYNEYLLGYVDDTLLFSIKDKQVASGQLGLWSWKNSGAVFEALKVEGVEKKTVLWQPDLKDLDDLRIVDDKHAIEGPSHWTASEGVLLQTSNIHVPDTVLPSTWLRAGTFVLGGKTTWDDIQLSVRVRAAKDGVAGVMFRVSPLVGSGGQVLGHDYYRVSLDYKAGVWRLIKIFGGMMDPLSWGKVQLKIGTNYDLTIRAVGSELQAYLNGNQLFQHYDGDLKHGCMGLHSWACPDTRFERVLVTDQTRYVGRWIVKDEGTVNAPSVWKISNGALLQTSDIKGGGAPDYPGTYAIAGDSTWTDYRLIVHMRSDDNDAIGVMFRYVDDENYYRLLIDQQRNHWWLIKKKNGKIHDLRKGAKTYTVDIPFTLTVDAIGDRLVGYLGDDRLFDINDKSHAQGRIGIYCWDNNGVRVERVEVCEPPLDAYALFKDKFVDGSLAGWTFKDEGTMHGPAKWDLFKGALRQTSNTHVPESKDKLDKKGTYALTGDPKWNDVIISIRLESHDEDDAIGIMFRYQDNDNYLRFSMDKHRHYCRLVKNYAGTFSLLWSSHLRYESDKPYELTIVATGKILRGFLDGVPMFIVEDSDFLTGRIAMYCWANKDSRFSQVRVYPAQLAFKTWLLNDSFNVINTNRWTFVDEHGAPSATSWNASKGALWHEAEADIEDKRLKSIRIALAGDSSWKDYRVSVKLQSHDTHEFGILFRYVDINNFYGLSLSAGERNRRIASLTVNVKSNKKTIKTTEVPDITGQEHILSIDCIGPTLKAYLDGVELFVVDDSVLSTGCIGLYCEPKAKVSFSEARVGEPVWAPYYIFGREDRKPAGTQVQILAGNKKDAHPKQEDGLVRRYVATLGESGQLRLTSDNADLRVSSPNRSTEHTRRFLPQAAFSTLKDIEVLRKADSTGLFIVPSGSEGKLESGQYRLKLTYQRDNRKQEPSSQVFRQAGVKDPEMVTIEVPWKEN